MQVLQLILAMTEFNGQVHQKNCKIGQFQLDYQAFDTFPEIMKPLGYDFLVGQNGIALFSQQGQLVGHRGGRVFRLVDMIVLQFPGNGFGLVVFLRAKLPAVHLDQSNNIRID